MGCSARAFMAAWLAGLLTLAHAGYDHSLAETYQWAQQLTHVPSKQATTMSCGLACQMLPEVADVHEIQKSVPYGTRGLVSSFGDDCLLVFQGSRNVPNFLLDVAALQDSPFSSCQDCRVHKGFYEAWRSLQGAARHALDKLHCHERPLRITGHSLGGAMAMLAAFELADKYHIKEVYTFGQPRVGNEAWVKAFEARMAGKSYFRVVSYMDPVPHLPPSLLMGYRHAGPEVWYSSTAGGSPTFCNKDGEGCSGQFSLASSLFHSCDHCSYVGLNPCFVNDPHPMCVEGAGHR